MPVIITVIVVVLLLGLRIVQQYQKGVVFRFGKVVGVKQPGLTWVIPFIDIVKKVDMRTITLPIPPQKIITRDNVSVDVSAVAYYKITDAVKSMAGSPISMLNFAYVISAFVFMVRDDMRKGAESEARELEKMEDILFFQAMLDQRFAQLKKVLGRTARFAAVRKAGRPILRRVHLLLTSAKSDKR